MKEFAIGLMTIIMFNIGQATEVDIITSTESVIIYHSGALVSRVSNNDLKSGINELIFKNLSSKIVLNSLKVNNPEVTVLNKSILRKLTNEEFNQLLDKKEALTNQMKLIEAKYQEPGFITKVEDLEKMTDFYSKIILSTKKELRNIEESIEQAENLEDIELNNENAAILKLVVSVDSKINQPLKIQYVCGGIGWSPSYEINVKNASDNSIEVKYLAKTMSQTGEDWNNVTVKLSSSFPLESPTNLPKPLSPWVLESKKSMYKVESSNDIKVEQDNHQPKEQQLIDQLEGVEYQKINIPSYLELRILDEKYSIKSNSTVFTFPIQTVDLPTQFYYYGYPSLDLEVYLVGQVTGWESHGFVDGVANITFNGNNIGKSNIKFSESKETLMLPIGKDNSVYMKRSEMADKKYFKQTAFAKRKHTTLAYQFELKNNNPFPIQFELMDQVPISQTKSAEVDLDNISEGNLDDETGEITWHIDLEPNQAVDKNLIFTIEMDAEYKYVYGKSKVMMRAINCPAF